MTTSELESIVQLPLPARLAAIADYINRAEQRTREARAIRDDTIRMLRNEGVTRAEVAEKAGVSIAHVAAVTGRNA